MGKLPLIGIAEAAANAAKVIEAARSKGDEVIYIRHETPSADAPIFTPGSSGVEINSAVRPPASRSFSSTFLTRSVRPS